MPTKKRDHHQPGLQKKPYSSPTLTNFGTIKELTSGGSGLDAEMTATTNPNKHP